MADTPQTLDDLSDAQRKALTWLSNQQGTDPVDPPSEYRSNTWKALDGHGLVAYDHDAGTVALRPAGRALFTDDGGPATAEAPAEDTASHEERSAFPSATPTDTDGGTPGGPGVTTSTGTGSPSAEQVAADDQPAPNAGTGPALESPDVPADPAMAGTVAAPSGEDPNPAPGVDAEAAAQPHEQVVSRLGDLRSGNRLVDPKLGACRVLGEPEPLYGTQAGSYRVPVMVVEDGRRDYVRGPLDAEIEQD
jgi:hypothetical protein